MKTSVGTRNPARAITEQHQMVRDLRRGWMPLMQGDLTDLEWSVLHFFRHHGKLDSLGALWGSVLDTDRDTVIHWASSSMGMDAPLDWCIRQFLLKEKLGVI